VTTSTMFRMLAGGLLALPWLAHAAGLGELRVQSKLGQPLRAEIPVVAVKPGEQALSAQIASPEAYAQAGLKPADALHGARVTLDQTKRGPVIRVIGKQSVADPAFDLLVELRGPNGTVTRAYSVLLDRPKP